MAKQKRYKDRTLQIRCGRLGGQLIRFEKTSFGWREQGSDTESEITGVDENGNFKKSVWKNLYFSRPTPYTSNFLFNITLSNIISFIRRLASGFFAFALIACIVVSVFATDEKTLGMAWGILIGVYGGLILATLLIGILGRIFKSAFKIEENLEADMMEAGYEYDE